jgi:hypothetical protein
MFSLAEIGPHLIFKGGTSLSKAYQVIQRFSEDIDVTMDRSYLGFTGEDDPAQAPSRNKRKRLLERLTATAAEYAQEFLLPKMESDLFSVLGKKDAAGRVWGVELTIEADGSPTINFEYPAALTSTGVELPEYIKPKVRVELGARGELWPASARTITPYAAKEYPAYFQVPSCEILTLEIERTFWEKATLVHAEWNRPREKPSPERLSRHYSDLAALAQSPHREIALQRLDLLEAVAVHKSQFFANSWAHYEEARPGTLHLVPPDHRLADVRQDFNQTRIMFFGEPPRFEDIIEHLRVLELEINRAKK